MPKREIHPPHSSLFLNRGNLGVFVLAPLGILAFLSRPWIRFDGTSGALCDALAWVFFVVYLWFRIWATLYLGGRKNTELQTQGPYSMTRNPLYFGSLCFGLSTALFLHSLLLLMGVLVVGVIYVRGVVPDEEGVLEKVFGGKFRAYRKSTPALIPNPAQFKAAAEIRVQTKPLFQEFKRLGGGALVPILAGVLNGLRPGLFLLP